MKCIGIVGSRRRDSQKDFQAVKKAFLEIYEEGDSLVSGGCEKGGDRFAEVLAKHFGLSLTIHYPKWDNGLDAGFVRNTLIAEQCTVLIACVASDRTGGTEDTVKKAKAMGKKVYVV